VKFDFETQFEASKKMLQDLLKHLDDIKRGLCEEAQKRAGAALLARAIGVQVEIPPIPGDCLNKFNNAIWIWSRLTDQAGNPIANKPADREWFSRKRLRRFSTRLEVIPAFGGWRRPVGCRRMITAC
jgi:hypothetical protein